MRKRLPRLVVTPFSSVRYQGKTWYIGTANLRKHGWRGTVLTPKRADQRGTIVVSTHIRPGSAMASARKAVERGSYAGFWSASDLIPCRDGKARRVEPGTFPLAHGVPARVGRLRGYGNAIVPEVAAAFITAFIEAARAGEETDAA